MAFTAIGAVGPDESLQQWVAGEESYQKSGESEHL